MPIDDCARGLPIRDVLPAVRATLREDSNLVLAAPPGAGKTTVVPLALMESPWAKGGRLLVVLPRRLAVRAAAQRMAHLLGEKPGATVGYRTRFDARVGPACRIECVTAGIFVNRLLRDPALPGVAGVLFDEVHERNLDTDLALALTLDLQTLRPELRIIAMSATADTASFAKLLRDAPVIDAPGQIFPLAYRYAGRERAHPARHMAQTIERALDEGEGALLAFLPGVAEIGRVAKELRLPADTDLFILHGRIEPAAQQQAIAPSARRKCVLATAIAETSLTIAGVRIVVDSGLARHACYDHGAGLTRLVTRRASRATVAQRAGRAGREGPGTVWRLWDEAETAGLVPFPPPEILEADLASLALQVAAWGVRDIADLRWIDPPPVAAFRSVQRALRDFGALDGAGRLTAHGENLAAMGMEPRLAHMLLRGAARGQATLSSEIALVLEEAGLGGRGVALDDRLAHLRRGQDGRQGAAGRLIARRAARARALQPAVADAGSPGRLLADAFPDRVAKRRGLPAAGDRDAFYLLANGHGARVDAGDPLARSEWIVVGDAGGGGADAMVRLAAPLTADEVAQLARERGDERTVLQRDPASGRYRAEARLMLGALVVRRAPASAPRADIEAALLQEVLADGLDKLPWPEAERALMARAMFARGNGVADLPDLSWPALAEHAALWLAPRLAGIDRLRDVALAGSLDVLFSWEARRQLDRVAPAEFRTPAGSHRKIDYEGDAPTVSVRVQALFGMRQHPQVAGVPLRLGLTSPAGRPIALTQDLPDFWRTGWRDVQRDMKGRYPRHPWPDDPADAPPTLRSKNADARRP